MTAALLSCPFCGSPDVHISLFDAEEWNSHAVECAECGADGPVRSERPDAIAAWNLRAPSASRTLPASDTIELPAPVQDIESAMGLPPVGANVGALWLDLKETTHG